MKPLEVFRPETRAWFERNFAAPTPAQAKGWPAIAGGSHVLIQAPTGSGKTLAAFLSAIDRLAASPNEGLRVLYVSPLKALNYDIERNLRGPLAGLDSALRVGVRTGDTPGKERRELVKTPPDILITTPESLFLLLTSSARETLRGVETVILDEVHALPEKIKAFLDGDHPIDEIARRVHDKQFFLYLGRHVGLPVCLEGALKLKEISYIPTDAYSAGEMKHGPIALLAEGTPVVVVATNIHVYDKIVSNIQETRARGAHVIAVATDGNEDIQHHADDVIYVPRTPNFLQASLAVIPLQLLAYRIARLRGLNVDQPRNLAKTVTVE